MIQPPRALRSLPPEGAPSACGRPGDTGTRSRGFTLVELLVALFVMSLMAILSWRGLDGMTRAQSQTAARADEVLAWQTGLAQWTADLDAIVELPQLTAIEWNGRVLRLLRRSTASVTDGVRVVGWARREGRWLRWQSQPLTGRGEVEAAWQQADLWSQNANDDDRRREVAVGPVEDWQLFYYRGDAWTNPLSSDVPSAAAPPAASGNPFAAAAAAAAAANANGRRGLLAPDGLRLVLVLPPGHALAGRITRDWVNPRVSGGKA